MRIRRREKLLAVSDDQLRAVLDELGLLDAILESSLFCAFCGAKLTLGSLAGFFQEGDEIRAFCDSDGCMQLSKLAARNPTADLATDQE